MVAAVLAILVIVDWLVAPAPERLRVRRFHSRLMSLGERGEIRWELCHPTKRRMRVAIADHLAPSLGADRRAVVTVPAGGTAHARTSICPSRRGLFALPGVTVRVFGPLGLAARQAFHRVETEMSVYPPLGSAAKADLWVRRTRLAEVGLRSAQFHGGGTEFDSLREYTIDDEYRRIDWAASARSSKPVVRTYRAEVDQRVICLLDAGRTMTGRVEGIPRFEHALDALVMLASVSTRLGDRCGVVAFDQSVRSSVPPARTTGQLGRVVEAVYRVQPGLVESDYHLAFGHVLASFPRRSMLVIFSELVESAVAESLVPALGLVARHHRVVVAAVSDPRILAWSEGSPPMGQAGDEVAYRREAARWTLQRRRRTASLLESRGVTVVDRLPGFLPHAVAETYARAKAMGSI